MAHRYPFGCCCCFANFSNCACPRAASAGDSSEAVRIEVLILEDADTGKSAATVYYKRALFGCARKLARTHPEKRISHA